MPIATTKAGIKNRDVECSHFILCPVFVSAAVVQARLVIRFQRPSELCHFDRQALPQRSRAHSLGFDERKLNHLRSQHWHDSVDNIELPTNHVPFIEKFTSRELLDCPFKTTTLHSRLTFPCLLPHVLSGGPLFCLSMSLQQRFWYDIP